MSEFFQHWLHGALLVGIVLLHILGELVTYVLLGGILFLIVFGMRQLKPWLRIGILAVFWFALVSALVGFAPQCLYGYYFGYCLGAILILIGASICCFEF